MKSSKPEECDITKPLVAYIPDLNVIVKEEDEEEENKGKKRSSSLSGFTTPESKKQRLSITDSLTPKDIDIDAPRSRRSRKSPVLYDPQLCAASTWQSEFQLEKALRGDLDSSSEETSSGDEEEDDDENSKGGSESSDDSKKISRKSSVNCDFCKDDKSISVCCFCACRVCFSKLDEVSSTKPKMIYLRSKSFFSM